VPFAGGASTPPNGCCSPIHFLGAAATLSKWSQLSQCTGSASMNGGVQLFGQCAGAAQVGLTTIQGGGHAPGSAKDTWDFLKTKALP
jgi:poly(3-hydroxybutyrate) depolymerase